MEILTKRVYDEPKKADGLRVLADRLWPRGIRKEEAQIAVWPKELTPSNELRKWMHADPKTRYPEFKKRFQEELKPHRALARTLFKNKKKVTLVSAVKDLERSHVPVLKKFLEKL